MGTELRVRDVRLRRGGRDVLVVDRLDVRAGEHVFVLGPNGAGKSTLLRMLAAVDRPDRGTVALDGTETPRLSLARRRRIGYVTQRPSLLGTSVYRNVELPLRWRRVPKAQRRAVTYASLERLRIAHLADRPARALSGGEQQRVNLARSLACEPDLLLLDEPAAGLDAETRAVFFADLERVLADRAVTTVQVTHRPEEALRHGDRVVVLVDGAVCQIGSPETINRTPADARVATVVGYDNLLPAQVAGDGTVRVADRPTGLVHDAPGPGTLATFANALRLGSPERASVQARVRGVSPGPGCWVVLLDGLLPDRRVRLVAHRELDEPKPAVDDMVSVRFDPARCAVLPDVAGPVASVPASAVAPG